MNTIYDHYWWGDFESRSSDEVNQNIKLYYYAGRLVLEKHT